MQEPNQVDTSIKQADKARFIDRAKPFLITGAVAFLLGVLLMLFALYLPQRTELVDTRAELQQSQADMAEQIAELERLESVEVQLSISQQKLSIFRFLAEINNARVALLDNDLETASSILGPSQTSFKNLVAGLQLSQDSGINEVGLRLQLAVEEVADGDITVALSDLEQLVSELLRLEKEIGE